MHRAGGVVDPEAECRAEAEAGAGDAGRPHDDAGNAGGQEDERATCVLDRAQRPARVEAHVGRADLRDLLGAQRRRARRLLEEEVAVDRRVAADRQVDAVGGNADERPGLEVERRRVGTGRVHECERLVHRRRKTVELDPELACDAEARQVQRRRGPDLAGDPERRDQDRPRAVRDREAVATGRGVTDEEAHLGETDAHDLRAGQRRQLLEREDAAEVLAQDREARGRPAEADLDANMRRGAARVDVERDRRGEREVRARESGRSDAADEARDDAGAGQGDRPVRERDEQEGGRGSAERERAVVDGERHGAGRTVLVEGQRVRCQPLPEHLEVRAGRCDGERGRRCRRRVDCQRECAAGRDVRDVDRDRRRERPLNPVRKDLELTAAVADDDEVACCAADPQTHVREVDARVRDVIAPAQRAVGSEAGGDLLEREVSGQRLAADVEREAGNRDLEVRARREDKRLGDAVDDEALVDRNRDGVRPDEVPHVVDRHADVRRDRADAGTEADRRVGADHARDPVTGDQELRSTIRDRDAGRPDAEECADVGRRDPDHPGVVGGVVEAVGAGAAHLLEREVAGDRLRVEDRQRQADGRDAEGARRDRAGGARCRIELHRDRKRGGEARQRRAHVPADRAVDPATRDRQRARAARKLESEGGRAKRQRDVGGVERHDAARPHAGLGETEVAAERLAEDGHRDARPTHAQVLRRRRARGVDLELQRPRERDAGDVHGDRAGERAQDAGVRRVDGQRALPIRQGDEVGRRTAEAERDVARLQRGGGRRLLDREVAAERLAEDRDLDAVTREADELAGRQVDRDRAAPDGDRLVDRMCGAVDRDPEGSDDADARREQARGAERATELAGDAIREDQQDALTAREERRRPDDDADVRSRDREAPLTEVVRGLLDREVALEGCVAEHDGDRRALDAEVGAGSDACVCDVGERHGGGGRVDEQVERACEGHRADRQARRAEVEAPGDAAVRDQERAVDAERRKPFELQGRAGRDGDRRHARAACALLLELDVAVQRLSEDGEVDAGALDAEERPCADAERDNPEPRRPRKGRAVAGVEAVELARAAVHDDEIDLAVAVQVAHGERLRRGRVARERRRRRARSAPRHDAPDRIRLVGSHGAVERDERAAGGRSRSGCNRDDAVADADDLDRRAGVGGGDQPRRKREDGRSGRRRAVPRRAERAATVQVEPVRGAVDADDQIEVAVAVRVHDDARGGAGQRVADGDRGAPRHGSSDRQVEIRAALAGVHGNDVDVPVTVDVADGERDRVVGLAADVRRRPERRAGVQVEVVRLAVVADEQVELRVLVDVREDERARRAGSVTHQSRPGVRARPGRRRDAECRGRGERAAEEELDGGAGMADRDVGTPVAVDVTDGDSGAVRPDAVAVERENAPTVVQVDAVRPGRDHEVERAVAVDVTERDALHDVGRRRCGVEVDRRERVERAALAVVQIEEQAAAARADDEVRLVVAVDIADRDGTRAHGLRTEGDLGSDRCGDVAEGEREGAMDLDAWDGDTHVADDAPGNAGIRAALDHEEP